MDPGNVVPEPKLDPPGAGLPKPELFVARRLFALRCLLTSREAAVMKIGMERDAVNAIVRTCSPTDAAKQVLIPRLRGLEDSSRNWSVLMTLEHLRLVNEGMAAAISQLAAERIPAGTASTANVKPSPSVDTTVIAGFNQSCDNLLQAGRDAKSLHTHARYAHPWFGPLDAGKWQVLGGMHLDLHRRQIHAILAAIDKGA